VNAEAGLPPSGASRTATAGLAVAAGSLRLARSGADRAACRSLPPSCGITIGPNGGKLPARSPRPASDRPHVHDQECALATRQAAAESYDHGLDGSHKPVRRRDWNPRAATAAALGFPVPRPSRVDWKAHRRAEVTLPD